MSDAATPLDMLVLECEPGTHRLSVATQAMRFAERAGVSRLGRWKLGITVAELASNVVRHAYAGRITISRNDGATREIVVTCSDTGPGIGDPELARRDGYSRGRQLLPEDPRSVGLGAGLGAVHRLMDHVEIRSVAGEGSLVVARLRF